MEKQFKNEDNPEGISFFILLQPSYEIYEENLKVSTSGYKLTNQGDYFSVETVFASLTKSSTDK